MSWSICGVSTFEHWANPAYLISQSSFLNDVHANVENVLHEFLALTGGATMSLAALLLILAAAQYRFSQHIPIPCLDSDANDVLVGASLVAGLKDSPHNVLEGFLRVRFEVER